MISGAAENTFSHGREATLSLVGKRKTPPDTQRWREVSSRFLQIAARWQHETRNDNNRRYHNKHWSSRPSPFPSCNRIPISSLADVHLIKIFWFRQLILVKDKCKWRSQDYWFQQMYLTANSRGYSVAMEGIQEWAFFLLWKRLLSFGNKFDHNHAICKTSGRWAADKTQN